MNEKEFELSLELWMTREQLADTSLQLWQYRRAEAQANAVKVAEQLQKLKGLKNGSQSS